MVLCVKDQPAPILYIKIYVSKYSTAISCHIEQLYRSHICGALSDSHANILGPSLLSGWSLDPRTAGLPNLEDIMRIKTFKETIFIGKE
jgi:hypothetical protein